MTDDQALDPRFEAALRLTLQELAPQTIPTSVDGLGTRMPRATGSRLAGGRVVGRRRVRGSVILAASALVLIAVLIGSWSSLSHPAPSAGSSAGGLISGFVDQSDGEFGYRMLRPANWTATSGDLPDGRRYDAPGADFLGEGLSFTVVNLEQVPMAQPNNAIWQLWLASPTLDGWAAALEQTFADGNSTVTPLRSLPNARIFAAQYPGLTYLVLVGAVVDAGQPVFVELAAAGSENNLDLLTAQGVVDDFATMVGSVRAISADPANVHPPLPFETDHDVAPSANPSPAPTRAAVALPNPGGTCTADQILLGSSESGYTTAALNTEHVVIDQAITNAGPGCDIALPKEVALAAATGPYQLAKVPNLGIQTCTAEACTYAYPTTFRIGTRETVHLIIDSFWYEPRTVWLPSQPPCANPLENITQMEFPLASGTIQFGWETPLLSVCFSPATIGMTIRTMPPS